MVSVSCTDPASRERLHAQGARGEGARGHRLAPLLREHGGVTACEQRGARRVVAAGREVHAHAAGHVVDARDGATREGAPAAIGDGHGDALAAHALIERVGGGRVLRGVALVGGGEVRGRDEQRDLARADVPIGLARVVARGDRVARGFGAVRDGAFIFGAHARVTATSTARDHDRGDEAKHEATTHEGLHAEAVQPVCRRRSHAKRALSRASQEGPRAAAPRPGRRATIEALAAMGAVSRCPTSPSVMHRDSEGTERVRALVGG